jgi:glyoxylase-like metal-dependent hydrolase (beta-lactamase superfamily II)
MIVRKKIVERCIKILYFLALNMMCVQGYGQALANSIVIGPPSPPPGFRPPPLNPLGVKLETRELAAGVYALMSNTPFADNVGFVVGSKAVLVIDSHFNGELGRQIIDAVRRVSPLPIKYLVNTNAFGDHVFGNYVFPKETIIVAHQSTLDALKISSVEGIIQTMSRTVAGDLSVFNGVRLRVPDVGFENFWQVDLGDRVVQMHWFGPSMSPSDSVVYVPDANIAWTANMVFGKGTIPWARSGDILAYQKTLNKFNDLIQPTIIVSGHGEIVSGEIVHTYLEYLTDIMAAAELAIAKGKSMNEFSDAAKLRPKYAIAPQLRALMTGFHRWNLKVAYKEAAP